MKIKKKLIEKLAPHYLELENISKDNNTCTFVIRQGENFPKEKNKGFIFIGKAVNRWGEEGVVLNEDKLSCIINEENQMAWVEEYKGNPKYNTRKSAFWRVIEKITKEYYSENWYSNIAWSNVYKIAPFDGGNPNEGLQKQQKDVCFDILKNEIEVLSPEYVIFFTSGWEALFIESIKKGKEFKEIAEEKWDNYKTCLIEVDNVKYIISYHPQSKKESAHVDAIIKLINGK